MFKIKKTVRQDGYIKLIKAKEKIIKAKEELNIHLYKQYQ